MRGSRRALAHEHPLAVGYADTALEHFPPLLVELVRAGARDSRLREEGYKYDEIGAVRALVSLSDREELDAGDTSAVTPEYDIGTAQTGEAVTASSG